MRRPYLIVGLLLAVALLPKPAGAANLGASCSNAGTTSMSAIAAEGILTCIGGIWSRSTAATGLAQMVLPDVTAIVCNAGNDGVVARNYATSKTQTCNGATATWADVSGGQGGIITDPESGRLVANCHDIKQIQPSLASGTYPIILDDGSILRKIDAYCEMEKNGGGWTLAFRNDAGAAGDTGCDATPFAAGKTNVKAGSARGGTLALPHTKFRTGHMMLVDDAGKAAVWSCNNANMGSWTNNILGMTWQQVANPAVPAGDNTYHAGIWCSLITEDGGSRTYPTAVFNTTEWTALNCSYYESGYQNWNSYSYSLGESNYDFRARAVVYDAIPVSRTYHDNTSVIAGWGPARDIRNGTRPCVFAPAYTKPDITVIWPHLLIMPHRYALFPWYGTDGIVSLDNTPLKPTFPLNNQADTLALDHSGIVYGHNAVRWTIGVPQALYSLTTLRDYYASLVTSSQFCGSITYFNGSSSATWYMPPFVPLQMAISPAGAITAANAAPYSGLGVVTPRYSVLYKAASNMVVRSNCDGATEWSLGAGTVPNGSNGWAPYLSAISQSGGAVTEQPLTPSADNMLKEWRPAKVKYIYIR